jgi:hypothetical protein
MLTGEIRRQIDSIWDDFWSGGVSNPLSVIEQITYLLSGRLSLSSDRSSVGSSRKEMTSQDQMAAPTPTSDCLGSTAFRRRHYHRELVALDRSIRESRPQLGFVWARPDRDLPHRKEPVSVAEGGYRFGVAHVLVSTAKRGPSRFDWSSFHRTST